MRLSLRETARIAGNFGHLLGAGVNLSRAFEVLLRHRYSHRAKEALQTIRDYALNGHTFYEGFAARPNVWPRYFIELIRCTERAGSLNAGLEEGADHFEKLARAWRAVTMLWLSPVCIILFGWLVRGIIRIIWVSWASGLAFWQNCLLSIVPLTATILLILYLPPLRRIFDRMALSLPLVAENARDLALYQFTTCFRYLYIGALSAPDIMRLAAGAVGNSHLRDRLATAAKPVENGRTFAEALAPLMRWPPNYIEQIASAEVAGQLEHTLGHLARQRKEALEKRVEMVRRVSETLITYAVLAALAFDLAGVAMQIRVPHQ